MHLDNVYEKQLYLIEYNNLIINYDNFFYTIGIFCIYNISHLSKTVDNLSLGNALTRHTKAATLTYVEHFPAFLTGS